MPVQTASDELSKTRHLNSSLANAELQHPPSNNQTHLHGGKFRVIEFFTNLKSQILVKIKHPPTNNQTHLHFGGNIRGIEFVTNF